VSRAIVGREHELGAVAAFLESVPGGVRALLLEGEPGIGKTRLWQAGLDAARAKGLTILAARPAGAEAQLSFVALGDLLEGVLEDALPELPPVQRRALEAALLLSDADAPAPEPRAVGLATLGVLRRLAGDGPVLVAVDDLQWADPPTVAALDFAVRRLRAEPVGLLFAIRSESCERLLPALERSLGDDRLTHVPVGPLSLGAVYHLLRGRLGLTLSRPLLRQLHETSGGNPFYALELGRALQRRGELPAPGEALPVPAGLQELVRERLAGLAPAVRDLLAAIAALSDPRVPLLEAAFPGADAALDAAVASGVIELEGERLRFAHPLLASGAYTTIGLRERRALHRTLAGVVRDPEQRARHLALATATPSEDVAAELDAAANAALARGAPDTAVELRELAIGLTPPDRVEELRRRRLELSLVHYRVGELGSMRALLESLVLELPPGDERATALLRLAIAREDDFDAAIELCERAKRETADPALLFEIEFFLVVAWIIRGDLSRAHVHSRRGLELAERLGDRVLVAKAIAQVGVVETWTGEATAGLLERGVELERTLDERLDFFSSPSTALGRRLMYAGRLDEARERFEAALVRGTEDGHEPSRVGAFLNLAELECRAGSWEAAEGYAVAGFELVEQLGLEQSEGAMLYARALVDAHRGRVAQARAEAEAGIARSQGVKGEIFRIQTLATLGFLELSLGDFEAADRYLRPLPGLLAAAGYREPGFCPCLPNAVEALLALGELEEARRLLGELEARGGAWAQATAARCRGLLADAEGDRETAFAAFERALVQHAALPMPFELARTLLALGSVQRRAQQKRAARETLERALELFARLGASLWSGRAHAELGRIGGRRSGARGELTSTERAIAELVVAGRANREIARELSLSLRTVEWNLSKIYRKLGLRSRTELAAAMQSGAPAA
jgi:DNA-binding CsgD family transcriptional regulator